MNQLKELVSSKKSGVRTTIYNNNITSFICQDNLYKTGKIPILARGLFVDANDKIVIRGYNKFFNIGEVPETEWDYLEQNTTGPYWLTQKENGCMIFISSDGNGNLYVSSKHCFTSPHAERAKYWLDIHLMNSNTTRKELSYKLAELNSTASFELCDDSFEEHILAYHQDDWGLHCHGLIKNNELFETYDPIFVKEFSRMYGFHEVYYEKRDTIAEVKEFCESREGDFIEGWVIRSGNMFFKYKYDKPYLVWREWREITKKYLKDGTFSNFKWRYPETEQYSEWVKKEIITNRHIFDGYLQNKGIVKIREMYLDEGQLFKHTQDITEEKILIIPVGAPGVGKSTICRILSSLLDAKIVENDSLDKKTQDFTNCVVESLLYNSIVIADRNNHLISQRKKLIETCTTHISNINICILEWDIPTNKDKKEFLDYKQILYERVENRGENHMTLTPKNEKYKEIIDSFLEKRTPLEYDFKTLYEGMNIRVIKLYVRDSLDHNMQVISNELGLGLSELIMKRCINKSLQYKIPPVSVPTVKYWGLSVDKTQLKFIDNLIGLKQTKTPKDMHITLAYSRQDLHEYWKLYEKKTWTLDVDSICYNDNVIAVTIKNFRFPCENVPHITIAMTQETKPFESNYMLEHPTKRVSLDMQIVAFGPIPYF